VSRVVALVLALGSLALAGPVPDVTRATLDNGLRVVVAEWHELPLVQFHVIVGAGAAQDPAGKEGLAALTASVITRGTDTLDARALARTIDSLGGRLDASAGYDGTVATGEFLAKDFATGLDLLRQVLVAPRLARDEVRRARDEQLASIVASLENPSTIVEKCYAGFLYGPHPYGRPIEGRSAAVRDLGRGDVEDFHGRWYRPNATILVVVGDVQARTVLDAVTAQFGAWKPRPDAVAQPAAPPTPVAARRVLLVDKVDATQTQIRFGDVSIARNDPDYTAATVASTILGGGFTSRLIEELRIKRSLTYSAWSAFSARRNGGDFRVGTFTKSATTAETVALALQVEQDFRTSPPPADALEKAKTYLRGQFPLRIEAPDALAARLAEIEFHGLPPDDLVTYPDRVRAITGADVLRVAQQHMPDPDHVAIVIVGRAAEVRDQLTARFGAMQEMGPEACESLSAPPR
jgi:zinc protease